MGVLINIGTAGYSYKDWIGPFYPEGIKPEDMLEYYSNHFSFVEVNSSYYHMPGLRLFEGMDTKTPDDFKFAVKLFKGFTHEKNMDRENANKFLYSLQPIVRSGKFLCLLIQFPYSFHFNQNNMDYLKTLRDWFEDTQINVEFRNRKWINESTIELLKKENLGFVCVDEPDIKGLVGKVAVSTTNLAYVRMHGKNRKAWYNGKGNERYDYMYSREELFDWLPRVRELDVSSGYTVISFNNHPIGKAIESARIMRELLTTFI